MKDLTHSYGTINDSEPLISKPKEGSYSRKFMVLIGALILIAFGLYHTNSANSNLISYLLSSEDSLTYTIEGTLCSSQYAGDTNKADAYYLVLGTGISESDPVQLESEELVPEGTFTVTVTGAYGLNITNVTIYTEAEDSICVNAVSVTVGEYEVTNTSAGDLWISNACSERTTLIPCDEEQVYEFKYFFISSEHSDWPTVRESCQAQGGDLAIFDSEEAMDIIYELCETVIDTKTKSCYVGFDDFEVLNTFEWIDGSAFDLYDYVAVGEFHTSAWDRCGCISMRYTEAKPLADCTCDYTYDLNGICQSIPLDEEAADALDRKFAKLKMMKPEGYKVEDETRAYQIE